MNNVVIHILCVKTLLTFWGNNEVPTPIVYCQNAQYDSDFKLSGSNQLYTNWGNRIWQTNEAQLFII